MNCGKLIIFSDRNNYAIEVSIDKVYKINDPKLSTYKVISPSEIASFNIFNRSIYVDPKSYDEMLAGHYKGKSKNIKAVIQAGHKPNLLNKIKYIFKNRKRK